MFIFFLHTFIFTIVFSTNAFAEEQYDDIKIGNIINYHLLNKKYYFDFQEDEEAHESYTFTGNIDDNIDKQVKKLLKRYQEINKKT